MAIATDTLSTPRLRVAISGGGPAGLAAAIALLGKPGFEVTIYEQATELREVGAGLRVGYNSWRVLELLGVADKVHGHIKVDHQHRDGVTGEQLFKYPPYEGEWRYHDTRVRRTVLQDALKSRVPSDIIQLKKRLVTVAQQSQGGVRLDFEDVVSNQEEIDAGKGLWELTLRAYEDPAEAKGKKYSWGIPVSNERVASHFTAFTPEIREAIDKVPEGTWKEFSAFSGPRLQTVIDHGNTVLIGDASHPLLGAFGAGAGFAMEDGWLLAQVLDFYLDRYRNDRKAALHDALDLFDQTRSPYYHRVYDVLDAKPEGGKKIDYASWSPTPGGPLDWIYFHDIEEEWQQIRERL
ncbi:hypothetical protein SLS53_004413 [Cytospora paraplurivora]|uniref:FAD-binding domain-containing protein n=1 Tax=Cytospora paraplurivora TaxID=2898453 RepID=A0AAN9YG94_9PEZI